MATSSKARLLPVAGLLWLAFFHGLAPAAFSAASAVYQLTDVPGALPGTGALSALASYEQVIAELETRQRTIGVTLELSEAYYGLGTTLQALERHEEAVEAFDKTLQALRENHGLYALDQLPVLQARIDSSQALASWQEVDAGMHLAHEITLKSPAASTEHRYRTLRELGLWKLRAAEDELLPDYLGIASDAAARYRRELERPGVRAAYAGRILSLANLHLDLAALEFLQARKKLALPLSAYVVGEERTITQMHCETIITPDGRGRQVCRNLQVPNLDYYMSLSDRKYGEARHHLDAMKAAVLDAYDLLLGEVATQDRDAVVVLLSEVHRLTGAYNDFVAQNSRRSDSRIAPPTGSRISRATIRQ